MGLRSKNHAKTVRWQNAIQLPPPEEIEEIVLEEPNKVDNQEDVIQESIVDDISEVDLPPIVEEHKLQQGDIINFEGNLLVVDHVENEIVTANNPAIEIVAPAKDVSYIDTIVDTSPNDLVGKVVENRSTGIREVVVGWGKYEWPHDITYIALGNSGRVDYNIFKVLFKIEKSS